MSFSGSSVKGESDPKIQRHNLFLEIDKEIHIVGKYVEAQL